MAPPKPKFSEGEKVLCFHGPLIYEAKCLKNTVTKDKHVRYFIHYAGWNKNWDEWVPESRVLKYNEANLQRQKEVQKTHSVQPTKTKKTAAKDAETSSTSKAATVAKEEPDSASDQTKKKRGRLDLSIEYEEQYVAKTEVKIKMPEELKVWLVEDWDMITRQQKLAMLPAKLTVEQIVHNYLADKSSKAQNTSKDPIPAVITEGIKEYFNATLGSKLLYKFERPQHDEMVQEYPGTPMSKIYGSIHLLRLFSKIGAMLAYTPLHERALHHVVTIVEDFLKYMVTCSSTLFNLQDYGNTTPEYHRKIQ